LSIILINLVINW